MKKDKHAKRLALFVLSESMVLELTSKGILDESKRSSILQKYNIAANLKNAQNDYGTAQTIVQDILRQHYDYMITA
jgi:putative ABC transport system permease protein